MAAEECPLGVRVEPGALSPDEDAGLLVLLCFLFSTSLRSTSTGGGVVWPCFLRVAPDDVVLGDLEELLSKRAESCFFGEIDLLLL